MTPDSQTSLFRAAMRWIFPATLIAMVLGSGFYINHLVEQSISNELVGKIHAMAETAALHLGAALADDQIDLINETLKSFERDPDVAFLLVVDSSDNQVYGFHGEPFALSWSEFKQREILKEETDEFLRIEQPIHYNEIARGILIAGINRDAIAASSAQERQQIWLITGFLAIAVLGLSILLFRRSAVATVPETNSDSGTAAQESAPGSSSSAPTLEQQQLPEITKELQRTIRELEAATKKDKKNTAKLGQLIDVSYRIIRCNSAAEVFEVLIRDSKALLEAQEAAVFVWDIDQNRLVAGKTSSKIHQENPPPLTENDGVIWRTFRNNQSYFLSGNSLRKTDFREIGVLEQETLYLLSVPISDHDYKYGVVVYWHQKPNIFRVEDLHLCTALAHQAAITLNKIHLLQRLKEKALHLGQANRALEKTQQQVIQLQKMESLGTLVGGIAHDFNNILGIITPNIELLQLKAGNKVQVNKRAAIIREAAERATDLTRQLLMFSRNQTMKVTALSPNRLLRQLVKMFRRSLGKQIEVLMKLDPALPNIMADETRLVQVLMNLVVNARDAMPRGGKIILRTALEDYSSSNQPTAIPQPFVKISVCDTGTGIPGEYLDKIFDPFFTTKEVGGGTGLGLSVVYGIVQAHDGYIEIDTEEGKGTCFHLYFKPTSAELRQTAKPEAVSYAGGHGTILVVDDEEMIRRSLRDTLEALGYNVYLAEDGRKASEIVRSHKDIRAAIIDLVMPVMDGMETVKEIHKIDPAIKILISSGYADQEKVVVENQNVEGFLPKPYHIQELAKMIKEILDNGTVGANNPH